MKQYQANSAWMGCAGSFVGCPRSWDRLLKRVFQIELEHCPNCGGELKIIAATFEAPVINQAHPHATGAKGVTAGDAGTEPLPRSRDADAARATLLAAHAF
jgi:hypothetical protein